MKGDGDEAVDHHRHPEPRPCDCRLFDSIPPAFAKAGPLDAEIVVVDNGSTDNTFQIVTQWAARSPYSVRVLSERKPGLSRAHNRALLAAQGQSLAFH